MATTRQIELDDIVELLEPVDAALAGAHGGALEFVVTTTTSPRSRSHSRISRASTASSTRHSTNSA
jgi:hypothetical protein